MSKYAVITGASGDIGSAIARELAIAGYSLYLHYFRNSAKVEQLKEELQQKGSKVNIIQADLSNNSEIPQFLKQIKHEIDLLVLNSGNSYYGLLSDMTTEQVEGMIQLHLTSPILVTKDLLPQMITKKKGKVIIISSIWGLTGASCEVVYSTVKGGLNTFVKALAKEVAPSGITVNGVAPGAIETTMMDQFTDEEKQHLSNEIPFGRLGNPFEVANLVAYLASERSSYISGQIISINGAWYC